MYNSHQPIIAAHGRSGPDGWARVARFAMATARRPLYKIAEDYAALERQQDHADTDSGLTAARLEVWFVLWDMRRAAWWNCEDIMDAGGPRRVDYLVGYLASLPGLGLAKAGFTAQLIYGVSGCLDTHNLDRLGIDATTFSHFKRRRTVRGRLAFVARYNAAVEAAGGTAALWDTWCCFIAARRPLIYLNADVVSGLHVAALSLNGAQVIDLLSLGPGFSHAD